MAELVFHRKITTVASLLESQGFENAGAEGGDDDLLYEFARGGECVPMDDTRSVKRFRRLSARHWAKWFFTDAAGNPTLLCVAPRGEE